ncbi:MAG: ABC transporter ATP-binding protein [Helicobacteraceae bacterium]|nr:ABC transporter ATP-binding protein [Helicobacteraceae bacterium]
MTQSKNSAFLEVSDLTLAYKTGVFSVNAVENVSFSAGESERLILLGPSGCGKSTILKAIGGFIKPAAGRIVFNGDEIKKPAADRAMVFQEFDQLLPWKSALGNIVFALRAARKIGKQEAIERARLWLSKVGLSGFENSYPHTLSGGMKQRAAIARALALGSKAILMDEPFASLDALTRKEMQEELLSLWEETRFTLVFVTHSIDEALILGNKIVMFSARPGRVIDAIDSPLQNAKSVSNANFAELKDRVSRILFKDRLEYVI